MASYAYDKTIGEPVHISELSPENAAELKTHTYTCMKCGLPYILKYGEQKGFEFAHLAYTRNSGWECELLSDYSESKSRSSSSKQQVNILKNWYENENITLEEMISAFKRLLELYKENTNAALREVAQADLEKKKLQGQVNHLNKNKSYALEDYKQEVRDLRNQLKDITHISPPAHLILNVQESIEIPEWAEGEKAEIEYLLGVSFNYEDSTKHRETWGFGEPKDAYKTVDIRDLKKSKTRLQSSLAQHNKTGEIRRKQVASKIADEVSSATTKEDRFKEVLDACLSKDTAERELITITYICKIVNDMYKKVTEKLAQKSA